jgi:ABC-type transporter Mla subunit MlaD
MGEKAGEMREPARNDEQPVLRDGERRVFRGQQPDVTPRARVEHPRAVSSDDPAVIRHEMDRTRAEMSQTIDAIQDRLEPAVLKEHAIDVLKEAGEQARGIIREARTQAGDVVHDATEQAKQVVQEATTQTKQAVHDATVGKAEKLINNASESARETGSSIWDTIRNNPIPAGLIGIGLGWLMMSGQSSGQRRGYVRSQYYPGVAPRYREYGYATGQDYGYGSEYAGRTGERFGDATHQARESVGGVAHDAQSAVSGAAHDAQSAVSGAARQASETAGDVAHQAGQAVSGVASQTQETLEDLAQQARYQTWQARSSLEEALETNPLAVGVAAFGVGAAIALLAPTTRQEQEWMGETRDHLMHQAQETIRDTQEKIQHVVAEAGTAAKETAETEAKNQGLASSN